MGSSHTELLTGNLSSKGNRWLKCVMWLLSLGVLLVIVGDGEGFEGLIHYLAPEWVTPSTVTEHVEKHFEKKKDGLRVKLARSDMLTLALTSDCWTNQVWKWDQVWETSALFTVSLSDWHLLDKLAEKLTWCISASWDNVLLHWKESASCSMFHVIHVV